MRKALSVYFDKDSLTRHTMLDNSLLWSYVEILSLEFYSSPATIYTDYTSPFFQYNLAIYFTKQASQPKERMQVDKI